MGIRKTCICLLTTMIVLTGCSPTGPISPQEIQALLTDEYAARHNYQIEVRPPTEVPGGEYVSAIAVCHPITAFKYISGSERGSEYAEVRVYFGDAGERTIDSRKLLGPFQFKRDGGRWEFNGFPPVEVTNALPCRMERIRELP